MSNDSDDSGIGWLIGVAIVVCLACIAIMAICTVGVAIGAFYSIKDYVLSFAENVKPGEFSEKDLQADVQ